MESFSNGCKVIFSKWNPTRIVYVDHPPSFEVKSQYNKVYKLKKSLYGLMESSRAWYGQIDLYLIKIKFNRRNNEPTLYTKTNQEGKILIVCLYVDDIIYAGSLMLEEFKVVMKT